MQRYHESQYPILKVLILAWVVVYDKYKTALVSDPRHRIARVDFLRLSGYEDQTLGRFSYCKGQSCLRGNVDLDIVQKASSIHTIATFKIYKYQN
jgi:hypothetical protein